MRPQEEIGVHLQQASKCTEVRENFCGIKTALPFAKMCSLLTQKFNASTFEKVNTSDRNAQQLNMSFQFSQAQDF